MGVNIVDFAIVMFVNHASAQNIHSWKEAQCIQLDDHDPCKINCNTSPCLPGNLYPLKITVNTINQVLQELKFSNCNLHINY